MGVGAGPTRTGACPARSGTVEQTGAKRKFRVSLRTVVNLELDVEATGFREALEVAEGKVRPADYFDGNDVAAMDGVEVTWADEHAFAYVDALGENGDVATSAPALFAGSNLDIREDAEGGWRIAAEPEYDDGEGEGDADAG